MKKRRLKKWFEKYISIKSIILFSFIAMVNDFNFKGFIILVLIMIKLLINIHLLSKYTNVLDMED